VDILPIEKSGDKAQVGTGKAGSDRFGLIPGAVLRSVSREDRFFLLISVFIGFFSGLAVVCFRFAIDWCRHYLLGSGATFSPSRMLLAPALAGLVIAVLVIHVFPLGRAWRRQSGDACGFPAIGCA
jgi:hypothetical protein